MTPKTLDKYIAALKKKAASEGWSKAEYELELNKIYDEMVDQYNSGKISYSEIVGVQKKIVNAEKNMGLQGKKAAAQPAAPAPSAPMSKDEMKALKDLIKQKYMAGLFTLDEWDEKVYQVTEAFKAGKSLAEAEIEVGVKSASAPAPSGMTPDEYNTLEMALYKKYVSGLISLDEYDALKNKLADAYHANKKVSDIEKEIGCDPGTLATDESIIRLGKEFKAIYRQASKEMKTKLDKFLQKNAAEIQELEMKLADGTITQAEHEHLKLLTLRKSIMGQQMDQLTGAMQNANQKALTAINGEMLNVFAENASYQSYQLTQDTKMDLMFSVYDEHTAERLIREKPELLKSHKELDAKKDHAWNSKMITGAVTQAVIQGDSIPQLARRIAAEVGLKNSKAMMRYARTAMTAAQNGGRIEMLHQAQGMGIKCKKRWLATLDARTRDSHQHMDGVSVDVDEEFKTPLGSKMQYPGDPAGKGGDVWNCRCTLVYDYEGFPNDPTEDVRRDNESGDVIQNMTYDEWKAAKEGSVLNELSIAKHELAEAQKEYIGKNVSETKVYKDLWKDPVTLADYPDKADKIQAKRDYYTAEIQKYKDAQANGASWATDDKIKELQKKLKSLNEFEKHGQILQKRNKALKKVQDLYDKSGIGKTAAAPEIDKKAKKAAQKKAPEPGDANTQAQSGQFAPDAWDAKTKKAARNFEDRFKADKVLRPELDAIWDTLTDEEKYGVWLYTWNSNPMNKPLSGHHDSWDRNRGFVGYANAVWGHEDDYSNRNISGFGEMGRFARSDGHAEYRKGIIYATKAIEKSTLKKGQWLVRGSDENGLAGWFAGAGMNFDTVTELFNGNYTEQDFINALVGKKAKNNAFTSTGIAKDAGFSGNVKYRIYAPEGTKGIYAEPQSHYGMTTGDKYGVPRNRVDKIYKKGEPYKSVGDEAEIIIQRGTTYVCTGVKITGYDWRGNPNIEIEMEIVEQPDYFQYGDENTYDDGKTRHKK